MAAPCEDWSDSEVAESPCFALLASEGAPATCWVWVGLLVAPPLSEPPPPHPAAKERAAMDASARKTLAPASLA